MSRLMPMFARGFLLLVALLCVSQLSLAQSRNPSPALKKEATADVEVVSLGVVEWLERMHAAARQRNYVGNFVVSVPAGDLSAARIWHVREGAVQMERIEALSGPPRSTFRRNDQVVTFMPDLKLVKRETRENLDSFPNLSGAPDSTIAEFYGVRLIGKGRVAGFDADVLQFVPRDTLRFGYRIWSERHSGLVIKMQTLDIDNQVIEQSAFTQLQLDASVKARALTQMMGSTAGYRVEKAELNPTTAQREGWALSKPVAGFRPVHSWRRPLGGEGSGYAMQWTFSDGLATVSLFIEPYDAQRKPEQVMLALGATHTLTRRLTSRDGDWWLTAVGEVPMRTLDVFAKSLVRLR